MGLEILIPLAPFLMVIAIVVIPAWLKSREKRDMQETLRKSIEQGQPLPAEIIESLSRSVPPPASASRDIRIGVMLIAAAAGIAGCGAILGYFAEEAAYAVGAFAAIPGAIGLAFVILSFFNKNRD